MKNNTLFREFTYALALSLFLSLIAPSQAESLYLTGHGRNEVINGAGRDIVVTGHHHNLVITGRARSVVVEGHHQNVVIDRADIVELLGHHQNVMVEDADRIDVLGHHQELRTNSNARIVDNGQRNIITGYTRSSVSTTTNGRTVIVDDGYGRVVGVDGVNIRW